VVVSAQRGAGQTLQNNAESAGCAVEMAGLEPNTIGIRHPAPVVRYVDIGNEVLAASLVRVEAVGKTVESSDRHNCLPCESTLDAGCVLIRPYRQQPLRVYRAPVSSKCGLTIQVNRRAALRFAKLKLRTGASG